MRTKNLRVAALFDIVDAARNEVLTRLAEHEDPISTFDMVNIIVNEFADELATWAKERDKITDTHWDQGYRAHDANAPRVASERIPDDTVRRQWLAGWDAAHATMQAQTRTKRTP